MFKKLNLRACDGDRPAPLSGLSLTLCDSNLHQHGKLICGSSYTMQIYTVS